MFLYSWAISYSSYFLLFHFLGTREKENDFFFFSDIVIKIIVITASYDASLIEFEGSRIPAPPSFLMKMIFSWCIAFGIEVLFFCLRDYRGSVKNSFFLARL